MNDDLQHLKLLSVFHYVVAGIVALMGCFPIIVLMRPTVKQLFMEGSGTATSTDG